MLSIDALRGETAVSVGGRDKTVRFWKVQEESQLVFRGGGGSRWHDDLDGMDVDGEEAPAEGTEKKRGKKGGKKAQEKFVEGCVECVAMIDESTFVSGGDSGCVVSKHNVSRDDKLTAQSCCRSICLWTTQKKKPVFTQALAHGLDTSQLEAASEDPSVEVVRKPRWVTAIGALRYSDLFASGSWDGEVRLWKLDAKMRSFTLVGAVCVLGVVNSIQLSTLPQGALDGASWAAPPADEAPGTGGKGKASSEAVVLVAGVGKEPRFGRWVQMKGEGIVNGAFAFLLRPRALSS